MEKYTVDIDKVLDDFEETEALKIDAHNKLEESALEHCMEIYHSDVKENSNSLDVVHETTCDTEHRTNKICERTISSSLQNETQRNSEDTQWTNTVSQETVNKLLKDRTDLRNPVYDNNNQNAKSWNYEIFYKPNDQIVSHCEKNICNSGNVKYASKDLNALNSSLNACITDDEIICVSVQENALGKTICESHSVKDTLATDLSKQGGCLDDTWLPDKLKNDSVSHDNSLPLSEKEDSSLKTHNSPEVKKTFQERARVSCEENVSGSVVNKILKISNSDACVEGSYLVEQKTIEDKVEEVKDMGTEPVDLLKQALLTNISTVDVNTAVVQSYPQISSASELDSVRILEESHEENSASCSNTSCLSTVNQILNKIAKSACPPPVQHLQFQQLDAQDEDSGVSSQEDVSGNSPPEMLHGDDAGTVVDAKCDYSEFKFLNLDYPDCNQKKSIDCVETPENVDISANLSSEISRNNEVCKTLTIDNDKSVETLDTFAGARPKLDYVNDLSETLNFEEDKNIVDKEVANTLKNCEKLSESECPFDGGKGTDKACSEKKSPTEQVLSLDIATDEICEDCDPVCSSINEADDFKVTNEDILNESTKENMPSESFNEGILNKSTDESTLDKSTDDILKSEEEVANCNNSSEPELNSDVKIHILPRLQRPTTLDLPSRHVTTTESSNEKVPVLAQDVNEILDQAQVIAAESPAAELKVKEFLPCVQQQSSLGTVKPFWIPDAEAPNCMHCGIKFTVIKRRHHCRACGKVLCSRCCNQKARLAYLNKEDRICQPCAEILSTLQNKNPVPVADSQSSSSCGSSPNFSPSPQVPNSNFSDKNSWRPHPNNPDDYCSTIPPLQQIQLSGSRPPPTVMVPIGVLKRGNKPRREPKQVIFSDGIRPGGDLTEHAESVPAYRRIGRKRVDKVSGDAVITASPVLPSVLSHQKNKAKRILVSDGEGPLPPIVMQADNMEDGKMEWTQVLEKLRDETAKPINFALMKNIHIFVKLINLDCCFGKECWCFTSHGLCTVGQDEVMVVLERMPDENNLPRGIFKLFIQIYDSANKGSTFDDLGHIIFPEQILGSSDHRGFLFVRPSFQCLSKLVVPNSPFLVAILIHKWEIPWAKVFPLRLMLRLGAECRYYPCALVSTRERKPVYFEIGQTIMSVLADLRNYQFTIPVIPGVVVHMEEKKTCVNIPRNRYEKVMKVLNSNNVEHVLALGSNFSTEADSHLVCMQKEEGDYQTQAISIENTTRRVTGASFIVFSGALKSSSGLSAKFSIVEDGLLVQIPQETMVSLHLALRDMRDLTIECGQISAPEPEEVVIIQWTRDDKKFNIGVRSPIDGRSLEGVSNLRIHTSTDYAGENYLIRWTEVFFLEVDENSSGLHELVDPCRFAETIAQSCCMALTPYLDQLAEAELTKLGLRVTLDSEQDRVEYDIGSRGKPLPAMYMNALDSGLIPVILRLSGSTHSEPLAFELIFHILVK
ncbi:zinc finger FYVE domain-containing protein 9-like isoform X2 [Stegodyphus dumicola]|uniref:zinc finger FYVE domain-containing protein 9-like isoform X2 n=1 Tax=Stegodyphus dumicola TaxID=202533 RepID=UPI0015AEC471|nr:zinc finger FYVE domain-containing protein 9-like isoform X2 [Stegodyphus dumicola]